MPEVVAPLRAGTETIAVAPDGGLCAVLPYVDGTAGHRDLDTGRCRGAGGRGASTA